MAVKYQEPLPFTASTEKSKIFVSLKYFKNNIRTYYTVYAKLLVVEENHIYRCDSFPLIRSI
jgi:hypothetical protein